MKLNKNRNRTDHLRSIELLQWYCVRVAAKKEAGVEKLLNEAGHTTFVPIETKWRRANSRIRKRIPIQYPLIPRYVIVGFPLGETPWYHLATIWHWQGIDGLLCFNGSPARIQPDNIERLANRYKNGFKSVVTQPHKSFKAGDMVEIAEGAFMGRQVQIESIRGEKAKILTELFGSTHSVDIPLASLEAA